MIRGLEHLQIFLDIDDRANFVERAHNALEDSGAHCYAWSVVSDRAELLIETSDVRLSKIIQRLGTGYAMVFNQRYQRIGPVYQNRYASVLVEKARCLREMVCHVHLARFREGYVQNAEQLVDDPWSGHAELMGKGPARFGLGQTSAPAFGKSTSAARRVLARWMREAVDDDPIASLIVEGRRTRASAVTGDGKHLFYESYGSDAGVLGSVDFVQSALTRVDKRRAGIFRLRADGWTIDGLIDWICDSFDADPNALRAGRRTANVSRARALIAHLAVGQLAYSSTDVAQALGVSAPAISQALGRGGRIADENRVELEPGMSPP